MGCNPSYNMAFNGRVFGMCLFEYGDFLFTTDYLGLALSRKISIQGGYAFGSGLKVNNQSNRVGLYLVQKGGYRRNRGHVSTWLRKAGKSVGRVFLVAGDGCHRSVYRPEIRISRRGNHRCFHVGHRALPDPTWPY